MASFIRTDDHLTIVFDDGVSATVYANTARFKDVRDALNAKNFELARRLALPAEQVKANLRDTFGIDEEQVTIEHGIVRYEGKEMDNTLTRRMITMLEEGFDISPLKLFLVNLQGNPSFRAVNELYGFLEKGDLPITEDGYFLAYKKVRADFKDCHSGTYDNSIGQYVSMPRNEVDEDSRNECSNGLHFCSRNYLSNFGGEHIMIVKINPADVVAIPADYQGSKGRTCAYEVIGELEPEGKLEGSFRDTGTRPSLAADIDVFHIDDEDDEDEDFDDDLDSECGDPHCDICGDGGSGDEDEDWEYGSHTDEENRQHDLDSSIEDQHTPLDSAFVGIPDSEPVSIPRDVALELARSLDLEVVDEDLEPVIAISHNPNKFLKFDDIADAAAFADVTVSAIRRVLRGERKKTGGYEWKRGDQQVTATFTGDSNTSTDLHEHGTIFGGKPHTG